MKLLAVAAVAGALGALLPVGAARADSEQAISVGAGWATFSTVGVARARMEPPALSPTFGGNVAVAYERFIGSDFGLRGEAVAGVFCGGTDAEAKQEQSELSNALLADVGVTLRFDILKFVPYAFAGVGGVTSGGGPIDRGLDMVLVVGGGVDWLRSRSRSYGVEARLASFGGDVTVVTIGIRATSRWGFF